MIPIFDGHNDTLLRLVQSGDHAGAGFMEGREAGHLDLPRARCGGLAGGLFACFVPPGGDPEAGFHLTADGYAVDMPEPPGLADAQRQTDAMIACAHRLAASAGAIALCEDVPAIRTAMAADRLAIVLHLEGAEAIDADLVAHARYRQAGVRSIGPVWSRPNRFGHGVPFRYPADPDIGPGLTAAGRALVAACHDMGVVIDLSHLNAAGFWEIARLSRAPLVATHSNAHAICPAARNLTDDQLRAISDSAGLVGISLSVCELRPDGHNDPATSLDIVLRHMDHLLGILGPEGVALGSNFDGAVVPDAIGDAAGLQALPAAMADHGYDEALIRAICCENWLNLLARSWR